MGAVITVECPPPKLAPLPDENEDDESKEPLAKLPPKLLTGGNSEPPDGGP